MKNINMYFFNSISWPFKILQIVFSSFLNPPLIPSLFFYVIASNIMSFLSDPSRLLSRRCTLSGSSLENSSQRLPTFAQLLPAVPRLALLGQALSSLVSVVCDLSGGPLDDLLQLGLQTLHDGFDGVGDLLQLG